MASTYELIASQTLGSDTASVTFSSIPATYDDLALVASARTDATALWFDNITVRFNGDSGANYSSRVLYGYNGSAASTTGGTTYLQFLYAVTSLATSNTFGNSEMYVPNYTGATNKSASITSTTEGNNANEPLVGAAAGLWSSTAAITSIALDQINGTNFVTGSSFYLYGVTHA